jgi:tRNA A-37 threonylcarbamoyl transferase component Bud32
MREPALTTISSKGFSKNKQNKQNRENLLLLHSQKFHPELTGKYNFKEGKHCILTNEKSESEESKLKIPQVPAQIDETIGPKSFVPIMILGKGSFGEVYLVQKKDSKMFYAMKVLAKNKLMGQNLVKYARTERNVLSYTKHSFIVGLNYAFQTSEKLFLILDYCPGGDLGSVLTKEKRFDEERARIYLAEVLLALEDLHKRDIIFRDLKPDNVVLDMEGHALLTDFGLSKEGVQDNKGAKSF